MMRKEGEWGDDRQAGKTRTYTYTADEMAIFACPLSLAQSNANQLMQGVSCPVTLSTGSKNKHGRCTMHTNLPPRPPQSRGPRCLGGVFELRFYVFHREKTDVLHMFWISR